MSDSPKPTFYTRYWKVLGRMVGEMNDEEIEEAEIALGQLRAKIDERKEVLSRERETG